MPTETSPDHAPEPDAVERPGVSWSGTVDYGPGPLHAPTSLEELRALVGRSTRIRALGTRHSFSEVAASDADLVTLAQLPPDLEIDTASRTVRVAAGVRYGELALAAHARGLAPANMGSLPHISVGGATATGTHGSGDRRRSLSSSVREIELVTADGDQLTLSREGDPEIFGGAVLALGTLGVLTHLTLDLVPAAPMRQSVHLDFPAARMGAQDLATMLAGGASVSLFHHWDGHISQAWVKQVVGADAELPENWLGGMRSREAVHPLPGMPADSCTDQSGAPGPAHERLPHFRLEFTPSNGEEIQSEYFVAREDLAPALAAVMPLGERIRPLLHASEVRTVAADELWLSPAYQRDSACVHFTWKQLPEQVAVLLPEIEERLAPFAPRPHWGKVFTTAPEQVRAQYPRLGDFLALRDRLDPERVFTNAYVDRLLGE
ncbi:MAG: FAD-binding protein [Brachybacterium sp.]|uniref:D-arabinono-1,4-lactone oxidase n=1 Tax=Brachybacterium sp. TaxID=1891286 RepID=UPI0026500A4C|nr:FAD-binding protein [Brachybacterium sp.]MDN6302010.1 FAD-binding protein [Brachybacterium sp.]MDN6328014.1 FAD-binding protein [Brachybacterium sp.]